MCSFQGTIDNLIFYRLDSYVSRTHHGYSSNILPFFIRIRFQTSLNGFVIKSKAALKLSNGDKEIRTPDPLLARQVLSQLSYTPIGFGGHLLSHIVSNIVPSAV